MTKISQSASLDALMHKTGVGFVRLNKRFDELEERMQELEARMDGMDRGFDDLSDALRPAMPIE
jgi:hypothetical protein